MKTYLSSAQLKDNAKEYLTGHYGLFIGTSLFVGLMSFILSRFLLILTPSANSIGGFIISNAISFIVSVFIGVFSVGTALLYLKSAHGGPAVFSDIFYGFSHHIETSLAISLVMTAISIIPTLAYTIPYYIYTGTGNDMYLFLMFPCLAAALIVYVPLSLTFSQCFFLMLDFPDKAAPEILRLSIRIMKGRRARLFYIEVSFLPLLLLASLSGIGLLWVLPYMQMTMAAFYFDIMKPEQN